LGHEWLSSVANRSAGRGCVACPRQPAPGQSLAERAPDVAAEWHPTRNGGLTASDIAYQSRRRVWWRCAKAQHAWEARTSSRTSQGSGCPHCVDWGTSKPEQLLRKWFTNSP